VAGLSHGGRVQAVRVIEDLLPIGRFAQLSRLSVKQLRHYDTLGLLPAAWVDEHTGYRYYRAAQAKDAMMIGLMRSLEVPLSTIRRVLAGELGELKQHRDELAADLRRKQLAISMVERVLSEGLPEAEVSVVTEPDYRALVVREVAADVTQIGAATSACVQRLLPRHRLVGLFPLDFGEPVPVAVAAIGDDGDEVLPGGIFAQATHVGPYEQINLTVHALLSWYAARGHIPAGPVREVYVSDPSSVPAGELVTQLMMPLEER
jgi:DNA-binding transcriptional MerR regulator